ncbi:MAG: LysR family transcriptional regulator [Clostridia bacterium]|jgi:DNA-binding transcriptional LysR family regulator
MNLIHLKYAVEIEKTKSISEAARNLFMGQPNLSRAIKELEESLGIQIFKRTSKGVFPTEQGEEFLGYARNILAQVEEMEALFQSNLEGKQVFSISVPRASYISRALTRMVTSLDLSKGIQIYFQETNNMQVIKNILQDNYNLGILRYQTSQEKQFRNMLRENQLEAKLIWEFRPLVLMSRDHPLASKKDLNYQDLNSYIEIVHGDHYTPSMSPSEIKKAKLPEMVNKRIHVFSQGSQFDLLAESPITYMWASPLPKELIERYSLIQRSCEESPEKYKDLLIYRNSYQFSELDTKFLEELEKSKQEISQRYP